VFRAYCCRAVFACFHIGCEVAFLSYYSLGIDAQGPPHERFSNFVQVDASEDDASADWSEDDVGQYPDNWVWQSSGWLVGPGGGCWETENEDEAYDEDYNADCCADAVMGFEFEEDEECADQHQDCGDD